MTSQTTTEANPRVQRRRVLRVEAILEAAESLLAERGYEGATLKAIGERAGIPTASVYHYFADRREVDAELLTRHLREMDARIKAALDSPMVRTLRDIVDAVIDPWIDYLREQPSLVELWFRGRQGTTLWEQGHAWDEAMAEQLWQILIDRHLLAADTPQNVVRLAFEVGDRLFDVAFRRSPRGDTATIDEARRLITAYFETYGPSRS